MEPWVVSMRLFSMNKRTTLVFWVLVVLIGACSSSDPEPAPPADSTAPSTTASTTPTSSTTTVETTIATDPATTTTLSASSTTVPSVVLGVNGWSLLPPLEGATAYSDYPIRAVTAGPDRLVAVGVAAEGRTFIDADPRPVVWVSDDALTWNRIQTPGDGAMNDVAWGDDTFVAVGASGGDPAVWLSADGIQWEQRTVPSPENGFGTMEAVIAVADGFFAAGHEAFVPDSGHWEEEDFDAAVWFSPDGLSWERIEDPALGTRGFQYPEDGDFNSQIVGIADAGWGIVFAGSASAPNSNYPFNTTVWVLREEWQRVDLGSEDQIRGVAAHDGVAVVHGSSKASPSADAVLYVSSDGVDWQQATGDLTGLGTTDGLQFVHDVVFVPNEGWLAVGSDEKVFSTVGGAAVWTAPPGAPLTWTRLDHDDTVFGELTRNPLGTMLEVTLWQDRVVVVGSQAVSVDLGDGGSMCCEYTPAIWLRDPP